MRGCAVVDGGDRRREAAARRHRYERGDCQCGGDMPGRCPGPELCPMADREDGQPDEAQEWNDYDPDC